MAIKIWWQNILPNKEKALQDFGLGGDASEGDSRNEIIEVVKKVARGDTEIEWHDVKHSSYLVNDTYLEMLNNVWLIDGVIEAEKKGYDAVIIGCGNDPGLRQARQAVNIPVIGLIEASTLLACTLGYKFGIITVMDELVPICEDNIRNYGLSWRAVFPVRVYQLGDDPFKGLADMVADPTTINPQFEELCHVSISDGAEVIIPACVGLSQAASLMGYKEVPGTGVPVIGITQAAVKFAEMLVDLKRTVGLGKSQKNAYKSVPAEIRDRMRALTKCIE